MRGIGARGTEGCVQMEWNKTTEITDEVSRLLNLQAEMLKHRAFHELTNAQLHEYDDRHGRIRQLCSDLMNC